MGFLDSLVGDLIAKNTGLPVKGLVRKVGIKNILLAGGAVAAGGMAAQKMAASRQPAQPPASSASPAPAPLPPVPGSSAAENGPAALPELPPVPATPGEPQADHRDAALDPKLEFAVVRTMIAAALSDGVMAPSERQAIEGRLGEASFADDAKQQVHRDLVLPAGPEEIAALVPEDSAPTVYRAAYLVVMSDGELAELERMWLARLASALKIDDQQAKTIEADLQSLLQA